MKKRWFLLVLLILLVSCNAECEDMWNMTEDEQIEAGCLDDFDATMLIIMVLAVAMVALYIIITWPEGQRVF